MVRNKKSSLILAITLVLMAALPVLAEGEGLEESFLAPGWVGGVLALLAVGLVIGTFVWATRGSSR